MKTKQYRVVELTMLAPIDGVPQPMRRTPITKPVSEIMARGIAYKRNLRLDLVTDKKITTYVIETLS